MFSSDVSPNARTPAARAYRALKNKLHRGVLKGKASMFLKHLCPLTCLNQHVGLLLMYIWFVMRGFA